MIPVIMQIISEHHAQYSESTSSDSNNYIFSFIFIFEFIVYVAYSDLFF